MKKRLSESEVPPFTHDQHLLARNQSSTDDPYRRTSPHNQPNLHPRSIVPQPPAPPAQHLNSQKAFEEGARARSKSLEPDSFAQASELQKQVPTLQVRKHGKMMAPPVLIQNYNWTGQAGKVSGFQQGKELQTSEVLGHGSSLGQEQKRLPFADLTPSPFERPHVKKEGNGSQEPIQNLNLFYSGIKAEEKGKECELFSQLQSLQIESFGRKGGESEEGNVYLKGRSGKECAIGREEDGFEIIQDEYLSQRTKNHQNSQKSCLNHEELKEVNRECQQKELKIDYENLVSKRFKPPEYEESTNYFNEYWQVYQENEKCLKLLESLAQSRNKLLSKCISLQGNISLFDHSPLLPKNSSRKNSSSLQGYLEPKQKIDQQSNTEFEPSNNKENMPMNQQTRHQRKVSLQESSQFSCNPMLPSGLGQSLPNNPELSLESDSMKEIHSQQVHSTRHSRRVQYIPQTQSEIERYQSGRKKHQRRCANEIAKNFVCPYLDCQKIYGSEGSLNLHMKIKHNAGSKTEREKLAKQVVQELTQVGHRSGNSGGEGKSVDLEQLKKINLPPGLIEQTAKELGVSLSQINSQIKKQLIETIPKQMGTRGEFSESRAVENISDKKSVQEVLTSPENLDVILQRKNKAKKTVVSRQKR